MHLAGEYLDFGFCFTLVRTGNPKYQVFDNEVLAKFRTELGFLVHDVLNNCVTPIGQTRVMFSNGTDSCGVRDHTLQALLHFACSGRCHDVWNHFSK